MGCDLSVCFVEADVSVEVVARSGTVARSAAGVLYIVVGGGRNLSAKLSFFALWSDEAFDLSALCRELSAGSRICVAWKSEHGGVGGYISYQKGEELDNISDLGEDYLLLPSKGVETTFGVKLDLSDEQRLGFPELLLDRDVRCFEITPRTGEVRPSPPETVTRLLEEELDVEPVLPVDTW